MGDDLRRDPRRDLRLGRTEDGAPLDLPAEALLRHAMALGSSGSGKTVFCKAVVEEALRAGLPALCVDPQGDLCSLAAGTLDDAELEARGVDPALAAELREKAEVVIFTPGSDRGVPLCVDPIDPALAELADAERTTAISRTVAVVVGLLGFDLGSDDGAGLAAVLDRALHGLIDAGTRPTLAALTDALFAAEDEGFAGYTRLLDARKIRLACQRLARLDVGARRLLFHGGVPLDVDVLLGRDPRAPVAEGRTRVAVVYLNTLHQQEDKDFFVAALADRLYAWMLGHPSADPQALFYIDEVAPFVPPVRKPACKEGLSLLFKQARKYGVCCLMATQNPGDVDYRAMAQFGTWALGRLTTRQDLAKIAPTVEALAADRSDAVLGRLPSLEPGRLVLLCPDRFEAPVDLRVRWLATRHETWDEARIEAHADGLRARFDGLREGAGRSREKGAPRRDAEAADAPRPEARRGESRDPSAPRRDAEAADAPRPEARRGESRDPGAGRVEARRGESRDPGAGRVEGRDAPVDAAVREALAATESATARELAARIARSESAVRRALGVLVDRGEARAFRDGRAQRYWAPASGGRPDLGMPNPVEVLRGHVDAAAAEAIAAAHARTKVLGLLGEEERFERAEPQHRLVYQLDFEERVERPLLSRLFGARHDERLGSVYLHPHNLGVLVFTNEAGIRFEDLPSGPASAIRDFDGVTEREPRPPGQLAFDEADWTARRDERAVVASFEERFDATPGRVRPLFVPLWDLLYRTAEGSLRRLTIDALVGKPCRWLPPDRRRAVPQP